MIKTKRLKKINRKSGFTLIEVTLFLALSSSIMLGIILATNLSVARQRYGDSVNDFADFLRGIYSKVIDVEHDRDGNTGEAIYGKLVTFREKNNNSPKIRIYDVVGNAVSSSSEISGTDALAILMDDKVKGHLRLDSSDNTKRHYEEHSVPWMAVLEKKNEGTSIHNCPADDTLREDSNPGTSGCFTGAVLIIRSPLSGSVRTYTSSIKPDDFSFAAGTGAKDLKDYYANFSSSDLDFCVDSDDNNYGNRRDIRLFGSGVNSSAVYMVEQDDPGLSKCTGK